MATGGVQKCWMALRQGPPGAVWRWSAAFKAPPMARDGAAFPHRTCRRASPVLIKMPKVFFVDDGPGKPEGANFFIGRRPIFAFGNSDGDKEMLEWIAAGDGSRFMGLVYHTDPAREYAYGPAGGLPDSKVRSSLRRRRLPETKVPGAWPGTSSG